MTEWGENPVVKKGAVIGEDGFGYEKKDGKWIFKDHKFSIKIGSDVRIGANCTIDRGRWRDTEIGDGTKIDNSAHIAHNVIVGKNCLIHAFVNLCGSCEIGDDCIIYPFCNIAPSVKISDNITVGSHSFVNKDLTESGTYFGVPARKA